MKFNEKLIMLRKNKNLSQEELGNELGVARQTVSKWELGETTPEMDKLVKMSEIFEISLDELMKDSQIDVNVGDNANNSNTQKLAGLTIKILKGIGIFLLVSITLLVIMIITSFIMFDSLKGKSKVTVENVEESVFGSVIINWTKKIRTC